MNNKEKIQTAIDLRTKDGLSISEISKKINVPYTTITRWIKDYPLTNKQQIELAYRNPNYKNSQISSKIYSNECRKKRLESQQIGRKIAKNTNMSLWLIGAMLYWGEGTKARRNTVDFTNSDANMIKLFLRFVREELMVNNKSIKISINCYNDIHTVEQIEEFWLRETKLTKTNLHKTMVNKYSICSKKSRNRMCEFGTCKIRICDVNLAQQIFGFIKEVANISDENLWMD